MLEIRPLKLTDFHRLHSSYDKLGSGKHFIDLYWLGLKHISLKWLLAQGGLFGSTSPLIRAILSRIYYKSVSFSVIAIEDGKILGHCFAILRDKQPDGSFIAEYGIWVSEESRGKGLGLKLTQKIIEIASSYGAISGIRLYVWENNPGAIELYKKNGFKQHKVIKQDKSFGDKRFDTIEMYLPIVFGTDKKKTALFIANGIDENNPGVAGGETRFIEIAKGWSSRGLIIHLLSSKGGYKLCSDFNLKVVPHYIRPTTSSGRSDFLYKSFYSMFLPKSLTGSKIDIVYSTNEQIYDMLPGFLLKIKRGKSLKWAVVVHWLPPYKWWGRKQSTFTNSFLFLVSERISLYIACLFADRILAVSDSTRDQIKNDFFAKFFIKKVGAVKCGVNFSDMKKVSDRVEEKKYDAVFLKRLQAVKGIFDLIDIWEMVSKKLPDAKLVVIGAGIDGEEARKRVLDRGLDKNIIFRGAIYDFETKVRELASAKLFLLPTYEENWAIAIGEAMAAGIPVFAYSLPELDAVWGDNYCGIKLGDKVSFADKVISALKNQQILDNMKSKALNFVRGYDWDLISAEELDLVKGNSDEKLPRQ